MSASPMGDAASLRSRRSDPVHDSDPRDPPWRIVAGEDLLERFCRDGAGPRIPGPRTMVVRTVAQKLAGYYRSELPHTTGFRDVDASRTRWARRRDGSPSTAILRLHGFVTGRLHSSGLHLRPPAGAPDDEAAFESFFAHEGGFAARRDASAPAGQAQARGARLLGGLAHLCRGQPSASRDLFKFALVGVIHSDPAPPGLFVRRDDAADRIVEVVSEMLRGLRSLPLASPGGRSIEVEPAPVLSFPFSHLYTELADVL